MTPSAAAAPPTLLQLIGRVLLAAVVHGPLASVLAAASAGIFLLLLSWPWPLLRFIDAEVRSAVGVGWLLVSHAFFIAFLTAFAASAPPLGARLAAALRTSLRALPHLAILIAAAAGLAMVSPWTFLATWAFATFVAAPSHFAEHGWRGWTRWPSAGVLTATQRVVLIAPSLAFLAAMTALLTAPQIEGWGLFEGGMVLFPLLGTTTFWASYSCALLSAEFRRSVCVNGG
jgi:hypothetical protein